MLPQRRTLPTFRSRYLFSFSPSDERQMRRVARLCQVAAAKSLQIFSTEGKMRTSDVRPRRLVRLLGAAGACLLVSILAPPAHAQFVCGGSATGAAPVTGGGATATGTASTACGTQSNAVTEGTAIGYLAYAQPTTTFGANTGAVAVGNSANSFGSGATALGAASSASADYAIGIGASSVARVWGLSPWARPIP